MIGATPPSSICTGARRRLCEFAPRSRESLILPSRGANLFARKSPRRLREFAPHTRESLL